MAISRNTKESQVTSLSELLSSAKLTTFAEYAGVSVAELQELRRAAREAGVTIRVVKNRLVKVAMQQTEPLKGADTSLLTGQLLYAISETDEVAPAQTLARFAKTHEALHLKGGFGHDGHVFDEAAITQLAALPTKDQLRGQLVGTVAGPLTGTLGALTGTMRAVLYALNARIEQLERA